LIFQYVTVTRPQDRFSERGRLIGPLIPNKSDSAGGGVRYYGFYSISFIEDEQLMKKILKSAVGASSANRLRAPTARQLKP